MGSCLAPWAQLTKNWCVESLDGYIVRGYRQQETEILDRKVLMGNPSKPVEVFVSYSRKDKDLMEMFETHLKKELEEPGLIEAWYDGKIPAGEHWREQIAEHMNRARVILLLMSEHFLESRYCRKERKLAWERHIQDKNVKVIPVILRECSWNIRELKNVQGLPKHLKPVEQWNPYTDAFKNITDGIRESLANLLGKPSAEAVLDPTSSWIADIRLDPTFDSFLDEKRCDFIGREWLFEVINDWLGQRDAGRALIIT